MKTKHRVSDVLNIVLMALLALICLLPFVHVIALSLSSNAAVSAGLVSLWPVRFTTKAYTYLLTKSEFWRSFYVAVKRLALGSVINIFLTVLLAYPLSKDSSQFKWRTAYVWFFFITMLINGGLIPTYMLVSKLSLLNTIWALVLPGAVPVFNVILMLNFFRQVPSSLEEAAFIDGAGHIRTLFQIYVPVSAPSIATIALFSMVGHWNAWFDGIIYMNRLENYPLQSYLRGVLISVSAAKMSSANMADMAELSDRTIKCSQIIIATIPILAVYPMLQRFFITGIVLGSVKE